MEIIVTGRSIIKTEFTIDDAYMKYLAAFVDKMSGVCCVFIV